MSGEEEVTAREDRAELYRRSVGLAGVARNELEVSRNAAECAQRTQEHALVLCRAGSPRRSLAHEDRPSPASQPQFTWTVCISKCHHHMASIDVTQHLLQCHCINFLVVLLT